MSIEEQFNGAVKVIRALPKSGPFKPSDDLRLKFYGFFKQATEGPNQSQRPGFFDLIAKYKWETWNQLGDMSKEDAMKGYVDVFIEVIKTMVLTDSDSDIFELLVPFKQYLSEESQQILTKHNF